jgi:hypothetical protein
MESKRLDLFYRRDLAVVVRSINMSELTSKYGFWVGDIKSSDCVENQLASSLGGGGGVEKLRPCRYLSYQGYEIIY